MRTAEARRDRDGAYRAYYEEKVPVLKTTKARYRLREKGQDVVSNWDRLKVKCFVSMNP